MPNLAQRIDSGCELQINTPAGRIKIWAIWLGSRVIGSFHKRHISFGSNTVEFSKDEVVERLRRLRKKAEDPEFWNGHDMGVEWARDKATVEEFEDLDTFMSDEKALDDVFHRDKNPSFSIGPEFFFAVRPTWKGDIAKAKEFWVGIFGVDQSPEKGNEEWLRGFVKGATSVWDLVKEKVRAPLH